MNRFADYGGQLKCAVAFVLGALASGAADARDRSVAPVPAAASVLQYRSFAVGPVGAGADCRLQNTLKRRGAADGEPALRTALYTWHPVARDHSFGGRADMAGMRIAETAQEFSRSPHLQMVLSGGSLAQKYKRPTFLRPDARARTGWLHGSQPKAGTLLVCTYTIDA